MMKQLSNKIRLACLLMVLALAAGALASCGGTGAKGTASIAPAVKPEGASDYVLQQWEKWAIGSGIDLEWYINSNSITALKDWSEYSLLSEVKQITGVSPKIRIPTGDLTEKVNTMIAMNDFPDIMTLGYGDPLLVTLIEKDLVYTLDELCETYKVDWISEMLPEMVSDLRYEDGKLYGIPGGYFAPFLIDSKEDIGAYTYSVRKDIYTALGKPSISTLDDFYNVLKLFKSKYPMMNGRESIALHLGTGGTDSLSTIQHSFGIQRYYVREDKSVTFNVNHPRYQEYLLFMNKLHREGLIDQEGLLKDKNTADTELSTCSFMLPNYFWYLDNANSTLTDDQRYISIEPMNATGSGSVGFPSQPRLGTMFTVIPKAAKNPEAALKFMRYMLSKDGNLLMMYGHEGSDYTITADGEIQRTEAVRKAWTEEYTQFRNRTGMFEFTAGFLKPMPEINMEHPDRQTYDRAIADEHAYDETLLTYYMSPEQTTKAGIAMTRIYDLVKQYQYKIITSETEAKAKEEYKALLEKIKTTDVAAAEKHLTEQYAKNLLKFGEAKY